MNQGEFYSLLTRYKLGREEPLNETVAVLSYEVGRMMEQAMFAKWALEHRDVEAHKAHIGFLKSELMDAIAQCFLICEAVDVNFEVMKDMGIEKAMERFTGKEVKV